MVIFTDDPKWIFDQPLFEGDRFIVSESEGNTTISMMTQCNDFIIINSTFSWWGAAGLQTGVR